MHHLFQRHCALDDVLYPYPSKYSVPEDLLLQQHEEYRRECIADAPAVALGGGPWSYGLTVAVRTLQRNHDAVARHYGWIDGFVTRQLSVNWSWPDVPTIPQDLLAGFERATKIFQVRVDGSLELLLSKPRWDRENRLLFVGEEIAVKFNNNQNPFKVLSAFQEENWTEWIDSPLKKDKAKEAVDSLNRRMSGSSIAFRRRREKIGWYWKSSESFG